MLYLLLAIVCSTCLLLVFKLVQRYNLSKLPVIVVNYFTAAAIGAIVTPGRVSFDYFATQSWFPFTVMLGVFFIAVFSLVALSTQVSGIAVTSVAFKLSLVIPVAAAFILYGDQVSAMKMAGITLALIAIFLTSGDGAGTSQKNQRAAWLLPVAVFTGSGCCDALFNYMQRTYLDVADVSNFLIILFLAAGLAGTLFFIYGILKGSNKPEVRALPMGVLLGIPNYGSAYFMMLALEKSGIGPSALWPLNNIGIILLSTAAAAVFFSERISRKGTLGIIIAVVAIALIAVSEYL